MSVYQFTVSSINDQYPFDTTSVDRLPDVLGHIESAQQYDDVFVLGADDWHSLLKDHLAAGNNKVANTTYIWNMGSAHDCKHLGTDMCQVDADECYAVQTESQYPAPLEYRRRQAVIWDHVDAATFAETFRSIVSRARTDIDGLRFSESGDFRTQHDVYKCEEIARRLDDLVDTYTYTASGRLDWSVTDYLTVNASNETVYESGADRRFTAVPTEADVPDDGHLCPHDASDGQYKCGDCRLCLNEDADDIYITLH